MHHQLRSFSIEKCTTITKEVNHLLAVGFIREVHYPDWLSNGMLVKKPNGKWRMFVNFTDLNKTCTKDCFPLPQINLIVDSTVGHGMLTFMDAYLAYNQIRMNLDDKEKTSFITDRGLYCYTTILFAF